MASTSRSARYAKWLSIPAGLVISALLIWQASYAAFTDSVESNDNTWTAGSVELTRDGDEGRFLFDETNLVRGSSRSETVTVTYSGTLDATVSLFGEAYTSTNELAEHISLRIEGTEGTEFGVNPSGVIYEGTLHDFGTNRSTFATGIQFPAAGGVERTGTFRLTYTLLEDAPQTVQGGTAGIDFVLKAQSS